MNDRLGDLKKAGGAVPVSPDGIHLDTPQSTGTGSGGANGTGNGSNYAMVPKDDAFMQDFFQSVEMVKNGVVAIKNATKRVGEINQDVILATTSEKESELSAELTPLIAETNKKAAFCKQMLQR